jgi:mono/diheme cytochrome c family protein
MVRLVLSGFLALAALGCAQQPATAPASKGPSPGKQVYLADNCIPCHGSSRQGGTTGPPLWNLADHWSESALLQYLQDPFHYRQHDARLQGIYERYHVTMPAALTTNEERLHELASYLLEE